MGAVTPIGNDAETFLSNLYAGVPGGGPITTFDTTLHDVKIAAEVKGFDPLLTMDRKMARRMSRFIHFGVAAATEAVERSRIDFESKTPEQRDRVAVVIISTMNDLPGYEIEEVLGEVFGLTVRSRNIGSQFR